MVVLCVKSNTFLQFDCTYVYLVNSNRSVRSYRIDDPHLSIKSQLNTILYMIT